MTKIDESHSKGCLDAKAMVSFTITVGAAKFRLLMGSAKETMVIAQKSNFSVPMNVVMD